MLSEEFHSKEDSVSVEAPLETDEFKYAISNIEFKKSNFYGTVERIKEKFMVNFERVF